MRRQGAATRPPVMVAWRGGAPGGTRAGAILALVLSGLATPGAADALDDALTASVSGDCAAAIPLFETALAEDPAGLRAIEAMRGLALCHATGPEPWRARSLMAETLPLVLAEYGPASHGLARHHALWSEAEVRAGALDVAWRRSEAAITALRAAGEVDPYDMAAEIYRLAAIQSARGEMAAFCTFLEAERARLASIDWAAEGDAALFAEAVPSPPEGEAAFRDWVRAGLADLDPRPLYAGLVGS